MTPCNPGNPLSPCRKAQRSDGGVGREKGSVNCDRCVGVLTWPSRRVQNSGCACKVLLSRQHLHQRQSEEDLPPSEEGWNISQRRP